MQQQKRKYRTAKRYLLYVITVLHTPLTIIKIVIAGILLADQYADEVFKKLLDEADSETDKEEEEEKIKDKPE